MSWIDLNIAAMGIGVIWKILREIFKSPLKDSVIWLGKFSKRVYTRDAMPDELADKLAMDAQSGDRPRRAGGGDDSGLLHMQVQKPPKPKTARAIEVNSHFKLVFITITIGTLLAAMGAAAIAVLEPHATGNLDDLYKNLTHTWTLGAGAILGLLGGKAIK